jgi:hypothetical protein
MSIVYQIVGGILLVVLLAYLLVTFLYPSTGEQHVVKVLTPLNKKKDILMPDVTQQLLLGSNGSTVMGFYKLADGDRTGAYHGQFVPLLQVENNWYLEIAATPVDKHGTTTRLRVQTNHAGTLKEEHIDLPPIPKQKWMFIAVLREGRRFDVIYNNKIVASERLQNYPVVISSPLSVGNKGVDGTVIHVIANGTRLTPSEVERTRLSYVDTNGMVVDDNAIDVSFPNISLFTQCPPGLPCDPITRPPSNGMFEWNSPYA